MSQRALVAHWDLPLASDAPGASWPPCFVSCQTCWTCTEVAASTESIKHRQRCTAGSPAREPRPHVDCSAKAALAAPCGVQRRRGGRREGHWLGRGKKRSVTNKVVKRSRAESSWPTLCRCFTGLSSRRCLSKQRSCFLAWQSHVSLSNTERFHCVSLSRCCFLRPTGQRLMSPWRYLECGLVFWTTPRLLLSFFVAVAAEIVVHTWGAWYVLPNGGEILYSGYQARNFNKQLLHQNLALKVVWPWWWLVSALEWLSVVVF